MQSRGDSSWIICLFGNIKSDIMLRLLNVYSKKYGDLVRQRKGDSRTNLDSRSLSMSFPFFNYRFIIRMDFILGLILFVGLHLYKYLKKRDVRQLLLLMLRELPHISLQPDTEFFSTSLSE